MKISSEFHSKNYNLRVNTQDRIKYIILHYTEVNFDEAIDILCNSRGQDNVSAHYLISKSGKIFHLVGDFYKAWHAGKSKWRGDKNLNDISIGIEIENLPNEPYTTNQFNSLIELCKHLMKKYNIFPENVLAHSDIAPNRKIDPGVHFDWHYLSKYSIGMSFKSVDHQFQKLDLTENKDMLIDIQKRLHFLGYDINITGDYDKQTSDVFRAFQLHFNPYAINAQGGLDYISNLENFVVWDENSNDILYDLVKILPN